MSSRPVALECKAREGCYIGTAGDVAGAVFAAEFRCKRAQRALLTAGHHDARTFAGEAARDDLAHVVFAGGT